MPANIHTDLRRWVREPIAIPVTIVVKDREFESDTTTGTIDICLSGLRVHTPLTLVPGQQVLIAIKGEFSHTIPARVVWTRKDITCGQTIAGLKMLSYPVVIAP